MKMHIMHDIIEVAKTEELICKDFTCIALVSKRKELIILSERIVCDEQNFSSLT
jgi:hypothetical protein